MSFTVTGTDQMSRQYQPCLRDAVVQVSRTYEIGALEFCERDTRVGVAICDERGKTSQ